MFAYFVTEKNMNLNKWTLTKVQYINKHATAGLTVNNKNKAFFSFYKKVVPALT